MMFSIGTWSMIVAAGWLLDRVRLTGSTTSDDGATPKLHIRVAPLTTWIGMVSSPVGAVGARAYRLRLLAGGHDLDPAVFRSRSEEHTSELQSLMRITYAVFCLKN